MSHSKSPVFLKSVQENYMLRNSRDNQRHNKKKPQLSMMDHYIITIKIKNDLKSFMIGIFFITHQNKVFSL